MLPLSAYLPPAGLASSTGVELARHAAEPAARDASAWFSDAGADANELLRVPNASSLAAPAAELSQRFLACLCDS